MKEIRNKRKKLICELVEGDFYVPMKEKELALFMQVEPGERQELKDLLKELLEEGKLQVTKRGKYIKGDGASKELIGTFISNARGFGFVEIEGRDQDLFIPEEGVNGAFHKDIVRVELLREQHGKRQEAKVTSILSHGLTQVVGTFDRAGGFGFVIPDNDKIISDIFVPGERSKGAVTGHKVVVELTDYGDERHKPEGKIIEILGHENDPGVDILSIAKGFDLPIEFPEKVLNQAVRAAKPVSPKDMEGRKDLRKVQMVTIDGEDAKDLDDAVSLSKEGDKYFLGVHIADVANYVQENSALDQEAFNRGTSVYLVDRVIPMLPHALSNGICSLNMGEDRLALSCLMTFDEKGEVIDYEIAETVICVEQRMSYTDVNKILEEDAETKKRFETLTPMFFLMKELADIIREKRKKRGSIDFDFPESKITLNQKGEPISIEPYERNAATKIIEDFMLIANETVAQHFYWMEVPFVYRTHDYPDPEKILKLGTFINNFGYHVKVKSGDNEIHPKEIQKLLGKIEGTKEEALISRLTLRSMKRAQYGVDCTGHFGLACQFYCHFTSPIRRYPDLQIHRIIKEQIRGRMGEERMAHYREILPETAKHSSETERRADEAERETDKLKKVQFMEQKIGRIYEGVISGITAWGIYVELANTVEGMIHVSRLAGDFYYYNEDTYEMTGRDTGRSFKLGQKIRIIVDGVDYLQKSIEFVWAPCEEENLSGR
ncbi:ribonuclease R [Parablautia intestinalis]|uniref:Ribonuclease R n=1 Tax=Parablautia intestinalis TaxID=2320100 RepID=A0A3A9AFR7_9FIRM|nr:ribonuclease R [Parablautia intestinalis]RKI90219.1 ribonuclease R [Parablautia intestinalis]